MAMIELVDFNEIYTQNKTAAKASAPKKRTRRAGKKVEETTSTEATETPSTEETTDSAE